ncbi:hypothetical protein DMC01_08695 [Campylobacter troglodytis]|nr:hypothetical protein DMC01_08695 [Campylobacter troglodytis]
MRGKRGCGAENTCVFTSCYTLVPLREGMLKRNGCVYTQIVKHCYAKELLPIIRDFTELNECEIYGDSLKAHDGLVNFLLRAMHSSLCEKVQRHIIG